MKPLLTLRQAADLMAYKDIRTLQKALARAGIPTIGTGRNARLAVEDIDLLIAKARTWSAPQFELPVRRKAWRPQLTPQQKREQARRLRREINARG